jgi:hypothetical protein
VASISKHFYEVLWFDPLPNQLRAFVMPFKIVTISYNTYDYKRFLQKRECKTDHRYVNFDLSEVREGLCELI